MKMASRRVAGYKAKRTARKTFRSVKRLPKRRLAKIVANEKGKNKFTAVRKSRPRRKRY